MKSIAYSQLIGKWYQIARTYNRFEMNFVEVFLYFSLACNETLDSLYVGIKSDRGKMLRKLSSKVLENKNDVNLSFNNLLIRKKLKIELFDDKAGVMILSDTKRGYLTVYSRSCNLTVESIEKYLVSIDFRKFNNKGVKLYIWET